MAKNQRRTRGAGSLYQRADGVWVATQELPPDPRTGKRRRLTAKGKSRSAAVARLKAKVEDARLDGELAIQRLPTLAEWMDHWLEARKYRLRPATVACYRMAINHIGQFIGETRLDRVTPQLLEKWQVQEEARYAHKTVMVDRGVVGGALKQAVKNGLLTKNPLDATEPPVGSTKPRDARGTRGARWGARNPHCPSGAQGQAGGLASKRPAVHEARARPSGVCLRASQNESGPALGAAARNRIGGMEGGGRAEAGRWRRPALPLLHASSTAQTSTAGSCPTPPAIRLIPSSPCWACRMQHASASSAIPRQQWIRCTCMRRPRPSWPPPRRSPGSWRARNRANKRRVITPGSNASKPRQNAV